MLSASADETLEKPVLPSASKLAGWGGGLAFACLTFVLLVVTAPTLAIVWDEGFTLGREERVRLWLRACRDPAAFARDWKPPIRELVQTDALKPPSADQIDTRSKLLSPRVLDWFWPFAREEPHGHPPFYALVGLVGDLLAPSWDLLPRARLGPMLLFSSVSGLLFTFMFSRFGVWPALLSSFAWIAQPNLFAHAHYATYDAVLTSLWVCAILAFAGWRESLAGNSGGAGKSLPWLVCLGVLIGCAADTKLTGWLLPLPFLAWSILFSERRGWKGLIASGFIALVIIYIFNPAYWNDPIGGMERFFRSNLTRGKTIPILTMFLGRIYKTPVDSLPWYNTLIWTLFVTPIGFLAFAIVGVVRAVRSPSKEWFATLTVFHWVLLMAIRSLPHAPGHDGVRQFLPAFGCLAILAGLGAEVAAKRLKGLGKILIAAAMIEGATSVALFMPVPLSYFSPIVGGLPGASALGMEPTFYWDSLTDDALERLALRVGPSAKVAFIRYPIGTLELRKLKGRLQWVRRPGEKPDWYVIQNRPGEFGELDRRLIAKYQKEHVLVSKFEVPLIWSFPMEAVESTRLEIQRGGGRR